MGSDLRAGAIDIIAGTEGYASEVLDALLDYLEEHADEWDDAAFQSEKVFDPSDDEPLWIGPKHLVAVLREVESE